MGKFATGHDGGQAFRSLKENRVLWIEDGMGITLPETLAFRGRTKSVVIRLTPEGFAGGLIESDPASLALVVLHRLNDRRSRSVLRALRDNAGFAKTRVIGFADPVSEAWEGWKDEFDWFENTRWSLADMPDFSRV